MYVTRVFQKYIYTLILKDSIVMKFFQLFPFCYLSLSLSLSLSLVPLLSPPSLSHWICRVLLIIGAGEEELFAFERTLSRLLVLQKEERLTADERISPLDQHQEACPITTTAISLFFGKSVFSC